MLTPDDALGFATSSVDLVMATVCCGFDQRLDGPIQRSLCSDLKHGALVSENVLVD